MVRLVVQETKRTSGRASSSSSAGSLISGIDDGTTRREIVESGNLGRKVQRSDVETLSVLGDSRQEE